MNNTSSQATNNVLSNTLSALNNQNLKGGTINNNGSTSVTNQGNNHNNMNGNSTFYQTHMNGSTNFSNGLSHTQYMNSN